MNCSIHVCICLSQQEPPWISVVVPSVLQSHVTEYRWQQLPHVLLLSRQKICRDKHMFLVTNVCLSWQSMSFVVTKVHVFVETKLLSWQTYFCHAKRCVLSWQTCVCHDRSMLVVRICCCCCDKSFLVTRIFCCDNFIFFASKLLSWQAYFCRDKDVFCHNKYVSVMTKCLSRQKW